MKTNKKTECVQHTRTTLTGRDIMRMLSASNKLKITKDTRVFINVPTGGDFSGVQLDIDNECPIVVTSKSYDNEGKRAKK